jgi:predicted component of type VI protein secretion system
MNANLIRFKKNGSPKAFPLPDGTTIIGRQHDCTLRIPIMSVSKKHCQITLTDGTLKICDLGSHYGTYLDDKQLSNQEVDVQAGSSLRIGPVMFLFQIDGKPEKLTPPKSPVKKAPKTEKPQKEQPKPPQTTPADEAAPVQQTPIMEDTAEEQFGGFADLAGLEDLEKLDSAEDA